MWFAPERLWQAAAILQLAWRWITSHFWDWLPIVVIVSYFLNILAGDALGRGFDFVTLILVVAFLDLRHECRKTQAFLERLFPEVELFTGDDFERLPPPGDAPALASRSWLVL